MKTILKISLIALLVHSTSCNGAAFYCGKGTLFMTTSLVPYSKKIPLSQKVKLKNHKLYLCAVVDYWMYDFLNQWHWHCVKSRLKHGEAYYARRAPRYNSPLKKCILMHRVILGIFNPNIRVDHKDRNTLNNCEHNLRKCTPSQNATNKIGFGVSKYLGVNFYSKKSYNQWKVSIRHKGTRYFLGYFNTEEDAARAYDKAAKEMHGEFANLNFK
jgi:hypothetical protein